MNRAKRRRIQEVKVKYAEEIETLIEYERNSIRRIEDVDKDRVFNILRENRIGFERAAKITSQIFAGDMYDKTS